MPSTSSSPTNVAPSAGTLPFGSRAHAIPVPERCRHCDASLAGRCCHACGEDSTPRETSWQSWVSQWHRLLRTLRSLWFEPGSMAVQHLHGARIGYIPPLTLFLNAVALFFVFSVATQFQMTTLAFLFTVSLPAMLIVTPLRARFGDVVTVAVVVLGLAVAAVWNTAAARRIGAHRWPAAVAKGLAVVVAGFVIDSFMSVVAIWLALRLA